MEQRKYFAFISYCHRDKPRAKRLYRRLLRYRLPSNMLRERRKNGQAALPRRISPVFIDDEEMMGTSVKQGMQRGLSQSRFLIVVCSPNSAKSIYVNYEAEYFVRDGREACIIPYIIEGQPCSNDPLTECYPPAIRKADKLGADEQQLKEDALLRVIATILNVDMGVLSRKNKQRRIRQVMAIAAAVIVLLTALLLYSHNMNERIADQHRLMLASEAKRLTAGAVEKNIDMDLSILLARQACHYLPEDQVEESESLTAFRSAVMKKRVAEARDFLLPVHTLSFDTTDIEIGRSYADGARLACRTSERTCLYDIASGACVFACDSRDVFFSPDATWCIATGIEADMRVATGIDVSTGEVLFRTAPRRLSGMWSNLPDVVVFEDDSRTAYLVSGEGPDREPVEGVARDGTVTRYDSVPPKVRMVYDALAPRSTWYDMALTSAWYTQPNALRPEEAPLRDALTARGYVVENAQRFEEQGLLLYQCRLPREGREETLLFYPETNQLCATIPGRACYDVSNGCVYAKSNETVHIYRTLSANRNPDADENTALISGISRDGRCAFFLDRTEAEESDDSWQTVERVRIYSLEDQSARFEGELFVPQMQTHLCYVDEAMNGLLYLDAQGVFHYFDLLRGQERFSWEAEDAEAVSAMCFNEAEGLIAVALIPENLEGGTPPFLYRIELRDMERGALKSTCDITKQLDPDNLGLDITAVRLLNGRLLAGTERNSCLFQVVDGEVAAQSCISFDSMRGNSANPLCEPLTGDGLLFFTAAPVNDESAQCLCGIYDIERDREVLSFPDSVLYAYDAETGTLICQAYTPEGELTSGVKVYQRQPDGSFQNTGEILSAYPDMTLRGGRNALDRGCVLLENDACSEIYRLEDGMRLIWLDDTGFALRNDVAYDMRPSQSLGTVYDYRLDYASVKGLSEQMLRTNEGTRDFTEAELEKYYIVPEDDH